MILCNNQRSFDCSICLCLIRHSQQAHSFPKTIRFVLRCEAASLSTVSFSLFQSRPQKAMLSRMARLRPLQRQLIIPRASYQPSSDYCTASSASQGPGGVQQQQFPVLAGNDLPCGTATPTKRSRRSRSSISRPHTQTVVLGARQLCRNGTPTHSREGDTRRGGSLATASDPPPAKQLLLPLLLLLLLMLLLLP